jgi:thiol-disulfide isomerase/thioredoxin
MEDKIKSESDSSFGSWVGRVAFVLILFAGLFYVQYYTNLGKIDTTSATEEFTLCLNNTGAVMYGTSWCHYCQQQKTMFAPFFANYIQFVDCDLNQEICQNKSVLSYPTWIIDDKRAVGLQSMQQLSELSGCKLSNA